MALVIGMHFDCSMLYTHKLNINQMREDAESLRLVDDDTNFAPTSKRGYTPYKQ